MAVRFCPVQLNCCLNVYLARWYSDCAAAPKPAEMGLIPLRVTKWYDSGKLPDDYRVSPTGSSIPSIPSNYKYIKCIKL